MLLMARGQSLCADGPLPHRDPRREVVLPGFILLEDNRTFPITVLDLSYDGCKVETSLSLQPGERLRFSALKLGSLTATVRWSDGTQAGLCFKEPPAPPPQRQLRKYQRLAACGLVGLRRSGRQNYETRLSDLSPKGLRIEFLERPRKGEQVWVKLPGLDSLEAQVRWVEGQHSGIEFVRPVHPAVFDLLLARLELAAGSAAR